MIQASSTTSLSSVRRLTFEAYRRAEAMGLVEPAQPTEEFDITGVRKVLQGVRDAGIARSPVIELESTDAEEGERAGGGSLEHAAAIGLLANEPREAVEVSWFHAGFPS